MLDNVRVPVGNVLGTVGQGHKVAFNVLNFGRVKLGARNMSGVKLALGHAVKYAKERRQFGRAIAEFGLIKQKLAGMAVRAFVGDAMSYRALGDVDRAIAAESEGARGERVDDAERGHRVMKAIEAFAVECSINKVWTSEALAWTVDEALQVFGGNGYSREFPIERMYRDARITRIYEGTNEINRLLIPTRLLKQSPDLFGADAARALLIAATAERAADRGPSPSATDGGAAGLAGERDFVARAKRLAIGLLAQATQSYGDGLKEAQELQALIADIVIEIYAIESALVRAGKIAERRESGGQAGLAGDAARVYASDAADRIEAAARQCAQALVARGADHVLTEAVRRPAAPTPIDIIAARRRLADAVVKAGKSPF
jgi:alkylation response protein AidB-like acyl-CoA dehydrogenase